MKQLSLLEERIIDNFAGGGGASAGIELATGKVVYAAINHDPDAILMHETNHPYTMHYQESVWNIDPVKVCGGGPVGLCWFSPGCKHFSKAKGGKPVEKKIRGLAWIALRWAGKVRPRVIILENVEEFQTWGPVRRGKPVKSKAGQTFRKFVSQLRELGYAVEWRELVAADYGAPTTRKRFFLIARCDGWPIAWPEPTHAPVDSPEVKAGKKLPWRSAAEIIDWGLPCPSIFDTKVEIREKYGLTAQRPLRPNTMRRAARGLDKFVIKSGKPFLVPIGYGERAGQKPRVNDVKAPLSTVVSTGKQYLAQPYMVQVNHSGEQFRGQGVGEPMPTITGKHGYGIVQSAISPWTVTNTTNSVGEPADKTLHTVTTAGNQVLASAALLQYHAEQNDYVRGQEVARPICTVDAANRYGLIAPTLVKYYGNDQHGQDIKKPLHTVTANDREGFCAASLSKFYGGVVGSKIEKPVPTTTAIDHNGLQIAHVVKFKGQDLGQNPETPLHTITTSWGEFGQVRTSICRYRDGAGLGRWPQIRELLNTYCGYKLAENEVVLLWICGIAYFIVDVGLRMLTPRELYNANGFPPDYIIDRDYAGNIYPKSKQVARCGNAVPPPVASALVRANFPEWCEGKNIKTMEEWGKEVAV